MEQGQTIESAIVLRARPAPFPPLSPQFLLKLPVSSFHFELFRLFGARQDLLESKHTYTHVSIYIHMIYSLFIYTSYLYVVYIYAHHTNYSLHINVNIYIFLHHGVYVYIIYIYISNLLIINHVSILITIMTIILCFFKSLSPLRLYS